MGVIVFIVMSEQNVKPEEKLLEPSDVKEKSELVPSPSGAAETIPALGLVAGGAGVGTVALGTTLALGTAIGSLSYLSGSLWNPFYQNEKTENQLTRLKQEHMLLVAKLEHK